LAIAVAEKWNPSTIERKIFTICGLRLLNFISIILCDYLSVASDVPRRAANNGSAVSCSISMR
jgi:hypothetical protein